VNNKTSISVEPPTTGVVYGSISEIQTWNVSILLRETTDHLYLTILLPHANSEARITAVDVQYAFIGSNIACGHDLTIIATPVSEVSSTQITKIVADLGFISNLGKYSESCTSTVGMLPKVRRYSESCTSTVGMLPKVRRYSANSFETFSYRLDNELSNVQIKGSELLCD